jgi:DNA-binding beta-propeller fold protein YncE
LIRAKLGSVMTAPRSARIAPFAAMLLLAGCAARSETPRVAFAGFEGDLLLAVDADIPAFAYADGNLTPRSEAPDAVIVVRGGPAPALGAKVAAPNTVTTWPGAFALSRDGRYAYVIEGRQSPSPSAVKVESIETGLPPGRVLSVIAVGPENLRAVATIETAPLATGIAVSPDGRALAVSTEDPAADLQIFAVQDGAPTLTATIDLAATIGIGNRVGKIEGIAWHPSADVIAVNLGSGGVGFVSLERGAVGTITGGTLQPAPVTAGRLLSGLRWGADGRHLYALDTGWGPGRMDRITNGPGAIHVIAYAPAKPPEVIQSVPTGLSSESFAISGDGSLIATVNMERTYLPGSFPTGLISGRDASSASLFAVDPATGRLTALGPAVSFRGVLPQGIAFDRSGRNLAIAIFQDHAAGSTAGWIQYLAIAGEGPERRLELTDQRLPTPRGAHYLELLRADMRDR